MVRYPRSGGRGATGRVLGAAILRRRPPYPPPWSQSAKSHPGPRKSLHDRETSPQSILERTGTILGHSHYLPGLVLLALQGYLVASLSAGTPLPSDFPVLPPTPLRPYTHCSSRVAVRTFRWRISGGDGETRRDTTEEDFPHPVDRCVDSTAKRRGRLRWQNQTRLPRSGRLSISRFVGE